VVASLFHKKKGLWLNAAFFFIAGYSTTLGFVHLRYFPDTKYIYSGDFTLWIAGAISYTIGGFIYATKVPEKYFPKTFDICGASH
jgi:predicted membrane channel-forming protein YqfA (hemolysin III family)